MIADPNSTVLVDRPDTGRAARPGSLPVSEHARLTDNTAHLWRELVHLCWETPL